MAECIVPINWLRNAEPVSRNILHVPASWDAPSCSCHQSGSTALRRLILEQVRHNRQGPREVVHVAGVTAAVVRWAGIPAIRAIEPQAYFQPITDLSGRIQTYVILFCTVVRTKNDSFLIQVTHG